VTAVGDASLPWLSLLASGAAHGVNPAMGWLFAVGRGLQARDRGALWRAFLPLAAGHAAAIALAVAAALALGAAIPARPLRWVVAAGLLAVGARGLVRHRHVRLGGMRASPRELAAWSFLVASAHGAGLMALPFVLGAGAPDAGAPDAGALGAAALGAGAVSGHHHAAHAATAQAVGLAAPLVHTLGYLAATVTLAVVVYEKVGLRVLRRAWVNVNLLWSAALVVAAGAAALG
jgi:hypothetical protein